MVANKIRELRKKNKLTLDEVAEALGTSKQTIHRYENGIISNIPHEKIEMLAKILSVSPSVLMGWEDSDLQNKEMKHVTAKRIKMIGAVSHGEPIYNDDEFVDFVSSGVDADFCLRASGDSMEGARIYDGDVVFIKKQKTVGNGEIAAVIIDNKATLKRVYYYPDEEKMILSPDNPKYAPFVYIHEELNKIKIMGKAIAFQSAVR